MTAAVTPLEARCEVCLGTGSKSQFAGGELDCVACNAATERAAMNRAIEQRKNELTGEYRLSTFSAEWFAYQLGKAAAAPVATDSGSDTALAAIIRDVRKLHYEAGGFDDEDMLSVSIADLRAIIGRNLPAPVVPVAAQPVVQQEPVAYMAFAENGNVRIWAGKNNLGAKEAAEAEGLVLQPVYAAPHIEAQPAGGVASAPNAALVAALEYMLSLVSEAGIRSHDCCCGDNIGIKPAINMGRAALASAGIEVK